MPARPGSASRTVAPASHNALAPGEQVNWYRVEEVLGQGGFGITYLARDLNLDTHVALKEYFPGAWAVRLPGHEVAPSGAAHARDFRWGLERFVSEGRILARFDHPSIVRVMSVFEANGTAYLVMRFERGVVLQYLLDHADGRFAQEDLRALLVPMLEGLRALHGAGVIHRDLKPDNVFVRSDGSPLMLDFGAARKAAGASGRQLTAVGTAGYAPIEQYDSDEGRQGPWTDVYALGATLYRVITGRAPASSLARANALLSGAPDPLVDIDRVARGHFSPEFLGAIRHAMAFRCDERPQDVESFARELGVTLCSSARVSGEDRKPEPPAPSLGARAEVTMTSPDMVDTGQWEIDGLPRVASPSAPPADPCEAARTAGAGPDLADLFGVAVGPARQAYYVPRLARPAGPAGLSWNWGAALFTGTWLVYRKLYLWAFALYPVIFATTLVAAWQLGGQVFPGDPVAQVAVMGGWFTALTLLAGVSGDRIYGRRVRGWVARAEALGLDGAERRRWLRRKGGTNSVAAAIYLSVVLAMLGGGGWLGWRAIAGA